MNEALKAKLTDEERNEFSLGLLREWFMAAVQAFEDTAGTETTISYLRPHMVNAGKAGAHIFRDLTGITNSIIQFEAAGRGMEEMFLGTWEVAMIAPDGALIKRFKNCVTRGFSSAFCISLCDHCVCSRFNELEPSWNMRMVRSMSSGDTSCEWMIQIDALKDDELEMEAYRDFYLEGKPNPIPRELSLTLNHEYLGEFWVMTTRAFMEHSGGPKAVERLLYYMRHSGMSLGIRIADKFDYPELGMEAISDIVGLVCDLHRRNHTITQMEDFVEGTVHECPFVQSALPEMCQQYCAFFNGVCEVIDPSYEFVYDRMMTKGDSTCHWVIRKKGARSEGAKTTEDSEVLKRLASRYVMGEISKQEYEELKAILR